MHLSYLLAAGHLQSIKRGSAIPMKGNTCPNCSKPVMPYLRFLKEMEPRKTTSCNSCGAQLRLRTGVYGFLIVMMIFLAVISVVPTIFMMKARVRFAVFWPTAVLWALLWALVTNYLSWRFIAWVPAGEPAKDPGGGEVQ
jgi:uncharacterized protein (DUF983 family)